MTLSDLTSMPHRRVPPSRATCLIAVVVLIVATGCAGDAPVSPPASSDASTLYWALTLDHRAVTLSTTAPYDTIQLTATPRLVSGAPMSGAGAPTYTSLDLTRAEVSADGLVHALGLGDQIGVVASLTQGNLTHADTVFINITDPPTAPLATFSIHPQPGDSAKRALSMGGVISPIATDADGNPLADLSVDFESLDPTTAMIDRVSGQLSPVRPGRVTFVATLTAYGVTKADTLPYTIGYNLIFDMQTAPQITSSGQTVWGFVPNTITAGTGAEVLFINLAGPPIDVTFDDPTNVADPASGVELIPLCATLTPTYPDACGSGNIPAFARAAGDSTGNSAVRLRSFPVPGTYTWHSTMFGTTGKIVVLNDNTTP